MVKTSLVEHDIHEGRKLIQSLDLAGLRINAALWLFIPESSEWRLTIATPLVDEKGPLYTYRQVLRALNSISPPLSISIQNIAAISPNDSLVQQLKGAVRTGRSLEGIRFTRNFLKNSYIEDAYLYRVA